MSLLGLSGFFSSGTHQLLSSIGGWAVEALALLGILLLLSSCTLCTAPDERQIGNGDTGGDGGGSRSKKWAGRLLAVLSFVFAVSVCVCFFAQQTVFDAIGLAISDEELEELLGDLHAIYCADHYSDDGGGISDGGNGTDGSWEATNTAEWESELDIEFEAGVGQPGVFNTSAVNGTSLSVWGDERDCETMLSGDPMAHAGLRSWADLSPLVFAWLVCQSDFAVLPCVHSYATDECAHGGTQDTAGRWLVLLLGVTAARAVLLLKCGTSRHGSGNQGVYVALDSDQAGVM